MAPMLVGKIQKFESLTKNLILQILTFVNTAGFLLIATVTNSDNKDYEMNHT